VVECKNKTVDKLEVELKDAIQNSLIEQGSNIQVNVSGCPEYPKAFNGDSEDNIVNRLGTNGIQIENCKMASEKYQEYIARAVVDTIRPWINV
jgi:phage replication-related protein YjqB (UPF0714/DUF867 family)